MGDIGPTALLEAKDRFQLKGMAREKKKQMKAI